ncbi:hypothetical protein EGU77_05880 [Pseudomonas syringae pv. theae]|nr:hypothetical protein [Pseudomonas syringae pv. theae]MBL3871190.1 hypothetical protein [Pseudomonas syringae pv. theae]
MGCEAAPKQATSAVSGTPRPPVLLSVPDRSWTSPLPRLRPESKAELCTTLSAQRGNDHR